MRDFSIPSGATIDGIVVEIEAKCSATTVSFNECTLMKAGSDTGGDLASGSLATSDAYYTFGGSTNLWYDTWTQAEINNTGHGVSFRWYSPSSGRVVSVDHARETVYYTGGSGGGTGMIVRGSTLGEGLTLGGRVMG